jgi:hypothetical protein
LEDVVVVEGKFEIGWMVVTSEVVIGGAWDDSGMDVVEVDGWFREYEVVWVMVEKGCVEGELVDEFSEVNVFEVFRVTGEYRRGEAVVWVLLEGDGGSGGKNVSVLE